MQTVHSKLCAEDLTRLRSVVHRSNAVKANPRAYSATETEQIEMADVRLTGELLEKYNVEAWREWRISVYTGDIWYEV